MTRQQRGADAGDQRCRERQRRLELHAKPVVSPIRAPTRSATGRSTGATAPRSFRATHRASRIRTPTAIASYTISATATDEDGTYAAGNTVGVTVNNVAPTLALSGAANVNEGSSYTLNLSSSDPGSDTISQWTINWGDSTQVVTGNPSSVSHTYADGTASYTISATATDEDGTYAPATRSA